MKGSVGYGPEISEPFTSLSSSPFFLSSLGRRSLTTVGLSWEFLTKYLNGSET